MHDSLSSEARNPAAPHASESLQYLTFLLGGEVYGINISSIREVMEYPHLTVVPLMPAFIRGVMNLRGTVVPVIDLSQRLCLESPDEWRPLFHFVTSGAE